MPKKPKRKTKRNIKITKKSQPVKRVATTDASSVMKETKSVHSALHELTRDVKRIGSLEKNVQRMNNKFTSEVSSLNKKLVSTENKMSSSFNNKIQDLGNKVETAMNTMATSVHSKMSQQNEHFNDRIASLHSEMKIANGNASRRMDNIEEAILKMHEAVECLNDNWKEFTQSLMIEEKKR